METFQGMKSLDLFISIHTRKKIDKLKINKLIWVHRTTEFSGQMAKHCPKSGEKGESRETIQGLLTWIRVPWGYTFVRTIK